ncbi:DUF190 domain-containing protein [Alicyclobacillus sp. ALC3]|uniref:DUF190 domain-containing protein n=1 Tax=Alicyclobacillus sp. ALC3 TaxID=2796143 RepID=UPI002379EB05|nr:DUF190 domain-containing protein [Alicyclobacillus sp. ALC3]WDL98182.1 DUF190 domain-containing protein [Alicyclobacillus sp. ALC3]
MSTGVYLEVLFYDGETSHLFGRLSYESFLQQMMRKGHMPSFTVTRAWSGLDARARIQMLESDYLSAHVPVCVQMFTSAQEAEQLLTDMDEIHLLDCKVVIHPAFDLKSWVGGGYMACRSESDGAVVKVYMNETDRVDGVPLALRMLQTLRELHPLWADVEHAIEGYEQGRIVRHAGWFSNHRDSMVLEAVFSSDDFPERLQQMSDLMSHASGPAILMPGKVIHYRASSSGATQTN